MGWDRGSGQDIEEQNFHSKVRATGMRATDSASCSDNGPKFPISLVMKMPMAYAIRAVCTEVLAEVGRSDGIAKECKALVGSRDNLTQAP